MQIIDKNLTKLIRLIGQKKLKQIGMVAGGVAGVGSVGGLGYAIRKEQENNDGKLNWRDQLEGDLNHENDPDYWKDNVSKKEYKRWKNQ